MLAIDSAINPEVSLCYPSAHKDARIWLFFVPKNCTQIFLLTLVNVQLCI